MKIALLCVLAFAAVAAASAPFAEEEYQFLFTKWAAHHGKTYESHEELFRRFNVFKHNLNYVHTHQQNPNRKFELAMNKFGDLTNAEFRSKFNGYRPIRNPFMRSVNTAKPAVAAPSSVDWRQKGVVTPVKDQGQCGSCWAFSTTGSVESAHAISSGQLISLSEQELVDCSGSYGNEGCNGGLMDQAFEFIIANGGLCTESAYPYTAEDGTCSSSQCQSAVTISGYQDVQSNSEDALKSAVAQQPVSVAVDAGDSNWQFYSGGVLDSPCGTQLDHGVLAAGYGTDSSSGEMYWLVKNSWGADWGESGYIRLLRHDGSGSPGQCGITLAASYPTA